MKTHRFYGLIQKVATLSVVAGGLLATSYASAFNVTGGITGWWEQSEQQNHGLIIATSQLPDGSQTGVIFWAHYDSEGNPTWLLGQGDLEDNTINADLYQVSGVNFMQAAGTVQNPEQRVGTLAVTFSDCKSGDASFTTDLVDVGSGQFSINRLTTLSGISCSGGISDDIPPTTSTERFSVALNPSAAFSGARGRALWVLGGGAATFDIEVDYVAAGDYDVLVGGVKRATFTARMDPDDNYADGDIEFHSPQRSYHPLLDFDPRGQEIIIANASGQTVLSATLPTEGSSAGIDYEPVKGERVIRQRMTNSGVHPNGYAYAEFEQDDDGYTNFEVDVDNVPVGQYTLMVNTIARATINVRPDGRNETEGEIEFYSPARAGYEVLDFDPRGALLEIVDGNTTVFFSDFPTTPGSSTGAPGEDSSGGDDSGPGDSDDGPGGDDSGPGDGDDGPGDDDSGPGDSDDGPGDNDDGWSGYDREIRFRLTNQGQYPRGIAMTEFSLDEDGREFEVELENVPAGNYTLVVGGVNRGTIRVFTERDDGYSETEGDIEFSERPDDNDELLLDFTVRGEFIEILEGSTVIFSGTFPQS